MKYLIIEDEDPAADRLEKMVGDVIPGAQCLAKIVSVKSAIKWFGVNEKPDLVFMDIQLGDGDSFEIFGSVKIECPVIFVTAYDQYALKAFKVNSVDYLLKPVKKEELSAALLKYSKTGSGDVKGEDVDYVKLVSILRSSSEYQKRLLIRFGDTFKAIDVSEIAFFYIRDRTNYLCTFEGTEYPVDQNLDQLDSLLDPTQFFRINRQYIINIKSIFRMVSYPKSRVKLELKPPVKDDIIVSSERSPAFKSWLEGKSL